LPSAERFEKWVFDDVLPTIRKDGGYVVNGREIEALIAIFPFLTNDTRASIVRDMYVENEKLNHTIEMQKPMVKFAEMVSNSSDTIEVGQLAKLAYDENIPIGRNGLFEWLRKNKILRKNNEPYQEFLREGWFEYIERPVKTPYGVKITFKTMVRGKGQIAIVEMLRREFGVNAS
jgi:anti-repressor protein